MTDIEGETNKLVKLFEARKMKDAKLYIDKIDGD